MHPLLKPAIWIGEVLHSSPGPSIEFNGGDFMPASFLLGNVAVIGLLTFKKRLSGALNVALLGLFINFVGLGLEGALTLSLAMALALALALARPSPSPKSSSNSNPLTLARTPTPTLTRRARR